MLNWKDIEPSLQRLVKVGGGFSSAHRGVVRLPDGERIFVKVGVDDDTRKWAQQEVKTYLFLARHKYPFLPKLMAYNHDQTAFALELLAAEDGWDWSDDWTPARLTKTLEAMDKLAAIKMEASDQAVFKEEDRLGRSHDGWQILKNSSELQQTLTAKLRAAGQNDLAETIDVNTEPNRSAQFIFADDTLVHHDVRADNCAWNARQQVVKLVDWNWTQLGDRRIDIAALLVQVQRAGFDILPSYADRLDAGALHWMTGFWLKAAATPIWPGGPAQLRDFQLESGVAALALAAKV